MTVFPGMLYPSEKPVSTAMPGGTTLSPLTTSKGADSMSRQSASDRGLLAAASATTSAETRWVC